MAKKSKTQLDRIEQNISSLVENDVFLKGQFDKLYDGMEALRNDVYEIKGNVTGIGVRLYNVEHMLATVKRIVDEDARKRKDFEMRIARLEKKASV